MTSIKSKKKVLTKPKTEALNKSVVSDRLTSYQKMKRKYEAKVRNLTDDIITLVEDKDVMKVTIVKMQWRIRLDLEKVFWFGSPTFLGLEKDF